MTTTAILAIIGSITGVLGALTGVASLAWQIVVHRRSGRLVKVTVTNLIPVYGPPGAPEFHDDDQVAITVVNSGGLPVTVLNYGVAMGRRIRQLNMFVVAPHVLSPRLPAVVEPGGVPVQLLVPTRQLRMAQQERGIPFGEMRPWVTLGDGRKIYARDPVPLI